MNRSLAASNAASARFIAVWAYRTILGR